jgi:hypothetical protein
MLVSDCSELLGLHGLEPTPTFPLPSYRSLSVPQQPNSVKALAILSQTGGLKGKL